MFQYMFINMFWSACMLCEGQYLVLKHALACCRLCCCDAIQGTKHQPDHPSAADTARQVYSPGFVLYDFTCSSDRSLLVAAGSRNHNLAIVNLSKIQCGQGLQGLPVASLLTQRS